MAFGNYEFPHSHNYDSDLRELIKLVKEYRDDYERILSTIDKIVAEFEEIRVEFDALNKKVDEMFDYIDDEIKKALDEYKVQIEIRLRQMQAEIDAIINMVDSILPAAKAYADAKDEEVKALLRSEMEIVLQVLSKRINDVEKEIEELHLTAVNPFTGYEEPLANVVKAIRDKYRVHALTNNEYADLGLTNTEYTSYLLNNVQYIVESKVLLRRPWLNFLNPATGMRTRESNVDSWIATMCANTITVTAYTEQNLTNEEYAALELTNLDYFFTQAADLPWE